MGDFFDNHIDFLDKLCKISNASIRSEFSDTEKDFLKQMSSSSWTFWLDKHNGGNKLKKLVSLANKFKNEYIIDRINYIMLCILELSKKDTTRMTDEPWILISPQVKQVVQSIMTLKYPCIIISKSGKWDIEMLDVCIPSNSKDMTASIKATLYILYKIANIKESSQMMDFVNVVMEFVINPMLDSGAEIDSDVEYLLQCLFFVILHPDYHGHIKALEKFIQHRSKDITRAIRPDFKKESQYIYLNSFGKSLNAYIEAVKKPSSIFPNLIRLPDENDYWIVIAKEIFFLPVNQYNVSKMNKILESNPLLLRVLSKRSKQQTLSDAMIIWKHIFSNSDLSTIGIFKGSRTGGQLAKLFYKILGMPCLEIIKSDEYVNSLSEVDKEVLALWTHACSLFQQHKQN